MIKKVALLCIASIMFTGCMCPVTKLERRAHYVNGSRYIPLLKTYIQADEDVKPELREVYIKALDKWLRLIEKKHAE